MNEWLQENTSNYENQQTGEKEDVYEYKTCWGRTFKNKMDGLVWSFVLLNGFT